MTADTLPDDVESLRALVLGQARRGLRLAAHAAHHLDQGALDDGGVAGGVSGSLAPSGRFH